MESVGLKQGTVKLVPYDAAWPKIYATEEKLVLSEIGRDILDIQHVGSTAVPGMIAKPIIDIAVMLEDIEAAVSFTRQLENIGYHYASRRSKPERVLFIKGCDDSQTVYLQFLEKEAFRVRKVKFRDILINDKSVAEDYCRLKQELADKYRDDRYSYSAAKEEFIDRVVGA